MAERTVGMVRLYRSLRIRRPEKWFKQLFGRWRQRTCTGQKVPVSEELRRKLIWYLNSRTDSLLR